MTTIAVVQARMGSSRLPGKVLADLGGVPMLAFQLRRLARAPVDEVVVATSVEPADDPVAKVALEAGTRVVRGPEADVLERFRLAVEPTSHDTVVRLTADCPLTDAGIVADVLALHRSTGADHTSNILIRTFPDGLDVEVVGRETLLQAAAEATNRDEREHVTPFVYRRPERFRLASLRSGARLGNERWTVDTAADLDLVRDVVRRLPSPLSPWTDVLAVLPPAPQSAGWHARIADAGEPIVVAVGVDPDDPGARVWVFDHDDEPRGWVRVSVRDGVGTLDGDVRNVPRSAMAVLDRLLDDDPQITHRSGDPAS